ncbi:MAG: hypothetical protein Q4F84_09015, partial [Fibrobacter sp.]|nr:hypothetical protein [Fibrobacter sp.]
MSSPETQRNNVNVYELYRISQDILETFKRSELAMFSGLVTEDISFLEKNVLLYEDYRALEQSLSEKKGELIAVHKNWINTVNSAKKIADMMKIAHFIQNCHFTESFNLGSLSESRITGKIEQYNTNVVNFAPFENPDYVNAGLTLDVEFIPFFDCIKKTFLLKQVSDHNKWVIGKEGKIFISITLQENAIEASWSEQLGPEDLNEANLLLFSVIRFNLGKIVVNEFGQKMKVVSPQYCQLLKPG